MLPALQTLELHISITSDYISQGLPECLDDFDVDSLVLQVRERVPTLKNISVKAGKNHCVWERKDEPEV